MATVEFVPRQKETEQITAHVIWMTSGLSCDGDSVAMTSATSPSLEDIILGVIPGMPKVVVHTPVLAYENGQEFMQAWYDAEAGKLDPFVLILEGSLPNEEINGEGHFAGMGVNPENGQPITTNEWIDRLAPKAAAVVAVGTCATYGGIPAMKNNPTGAMGLADYLGWDFRSTAGLPIVNIPGCPAQPDNTTETLLYLVLHLGGMAPAPDLDEALRPRWLFNRTTRESCNRGGFSEEGEFATAPWKALVSPRLAALALSHAPSVIVAAGTCSLHGAVPSHAASCQLSEPERATVASVKDAETLELTDGTIVRLIGAKTPQAPLGWHGYRAMAVGSRGQRHDETSGLRRGGGASLRRQSNRPARL